MINNMLINYHHAIFDLLDAKPLLSDEAIKRIAEREHICSKAFPASVKEWFRIEHSKRMFDETKQHLTYRFKNSIN